MSVRTGSGSPGPPRAGLLDGLGLGLVAAIFAADIVTPPDNVSICFAFTIPILIGVYTGPGSAYWLACATTLASLVGSFIRPPSEGIALSFVANRLIATGVQWLVAVLIEQHKRGRAIVQAHLAAERLKPEPGRRFVRIQTHELGSARTAIGGQSFRLSKLAATIAPADIVARTAKIAQAVGRLDAFATRIQLAAEVGDGQLRVDPAPISCAEFLSTLRAEHEGEAEARLALHAETASLYGDPALLYQAVSNLVANAIKYSAPGGTVTVTITRAEAGGTVISVSDQGSGIEADEVDRVFEPYYRARNSAGIRGLGLGLHLVRHFVEAHRGRIEIESRPGAGTCVRLHLPPHLPPQGPPLPPEDLAA